MAIQTDGVKVSLRGREVVIPPLTLYALRKFTASGHMERISKMGALPSVDDLDAAAELIHAALLPNYPEITLEEVLNLVDVKNLGEVVPAIMGQSGLRQVKPGEAGAP